MLWLSFSLEETLTLFAVGTDGMWTLGAGEVQGLGNNGNTVFEVYSTASGTGYVAIDDIRVDASPDCPINGKLKCALSIVSLNPATSG